MADNYLERRMEAYRAQPAAQPRRAATLERLLTRNRSVRGYDARFVVRADQLRSIVSVCTKIPSARNQQVLRFRLVLADEAPGCWRTSAWAVRCPNCICRWRARNPTPSSSSVRRCPKTAGSTSIWASPCRACCSGPSRSGSTGLCIGAFDRDAIRTRLRLPCEPLLILAVGKGAERIERVEIGADGDRRYYRSEGVHYVPKIRAEELIIDSDSAETGR